MKKRVFKKENFEVEFYNNGIGVAMFIDEFGDIQVVLPFISVVFKNPRVDIFALVFTTIFIGCLYIMLF